MKTPVLIQPFGLYKKRTGFTAFKVMLRVMMTESGTCVFDLKIDIHSNHAPMGDLIQSITLMVCLTELNRAFYSVRSTLN
jgi:hypothetical protein